MGPRLCRRGNGEIAEAVKLAIDKLQWGHAFADVETHAGFSVLPNSGLLQWGHAFADVETDVLSQGESEIVPCFNGATPLQTWKPEV